MTKISSSPLRPVSKAIREPSGDQAGSRSPAALLVRFTGSPPSAFLRMISPSMDPPRSIPWSTWVPSGEIAGAVAVPNMPSTSPTLSRTGSEPSRLLDQTWKMSSRLLWKAIRPTSASRQVSSNSTATVSPAVTLTDRGFSPSTAQLARTPVRPTVRVPEATSASVSAALAPIATGPAPSTRTESPSSRSAPVETVVTSTDPVPGSDGPSLPQALRAASRRLSAIRRRIGDTRPPYGWGPQGCGPGASTSASLFEMLSGLDPSGSTRKIS